MWNITIIRKETLTEDFLIIQLRSNFQTPNTKASWSLRSRTTRSALKLNFQAKNPEHFWSKFAPPEFRLIEYHRVSNLVMAASCKTYLLTQLLKFKIYYPNIGFLFFRMCGLKDFLIKSLVKLILKKNVFAILYKPNFG